MATEVKSTTVHDEIKTVYSSVYEIIGNLKNIVTWSSENPGKDKICKISRNAEDIKDNDVYIAGSSQLNFWVNLINKSCSWNANDTDVFTIGQPGRSYHMVGKVQFINTEFKSVDELLLDFDLPCCRAAANSNGNLYISLQCIASIMTGSYYLPKCMESEERLNIYLGSIAKMDNPYLNYRFERTRGRIIKYIKRGFIPKYCDNTTENVEWITRILKFPYKSEDFETFCKQPTVHRVPFVYK